MKNLSTRDVTLLGLVAIAVMLALGLAPLPGPSNAAPEPTPDRQATLASLSANAPTIIPVWPTTTPQPSPTPRPVKCQMISGVEALSGLYTLTCDSDLPGGPQHYVVSPGNSTLTPIPGAATVEQREDGIYIVDESGAAFKVIV